MPIACYFCQSACATCEHAVQRFVRDATDQEIQNLSASSTTLFRLLSRLKQKGCTLLSNKIDSVGNIHEEDCEEDWEALTPEDWLGFMEVIRGIVGEHDYPMNVTCHAKTIEGRAAGHSLITLLRQGIIMTQLIGDGDCRAISEIRIIIEAEFPGINPFVLEAMLPELKACINHKCKNMRYCSKRY